MVGKTTDRRRASLILTVLLIVIGICLIHFNTEAEDSNARPDIVAIDLPAVPGGEQMPAVTFLHDLHTEALKGEKDCSTCHTQKDNRFIFKFKREVDSQPEMDMEIYHDNCIGCHQETISAGSFAGPVAGDCRSCHNKKSEIATSWQPLDFNKSLHYRHESSEQIKPDQMVDEANCGACHHDYDKGLKKTVYAKGEEANCRYCHLESSTKEAQSIKSASHASCINCHQQTAAASKKGGPVNCAGCHELSAQAKIKIVDVVPRLKRKQPDVVLLASWMSRSQGAAPDTKPHINPVAFNHLAHESNADDCITCHHASLKRCSECHTETGDEKGNFISLEAAMHNTRSKTSCMGCHRQAQIEVSCAGCHATMPTKKFSEVSCDRCHAVGKAGTLALPVSAEGKKALAEATLASSSTATTLPANDLIAETVTINAMVDKYEPVILPHGKIINTLAKGMKDNRMARFFHNEPATMCMGCHHNAPATTKPPKCASCHGEAFKVSGEERPGLKGAYHGQCISCHQIMKIEKPEATDCTGCHKKRG